MENLLCIKGKIIGKGKPLVCVPVMERNQKAGRSTHGND